MKLTLVPKPRVKVDGTKTSHVLVHPGSLVFKNTANLENSALFLFYFLNYGYIIVLNLKPTKPAKNTETYQIIQKPIKLA